MNPSINILKTPETEALERVYQKIPAIACKRLCWVACGLIEGSRVENWRLDQVTGSVFGVVVVGADQRPYCEFLTRERECRVYGLRPLMCRLFGIAKELPCPHGCIPERYLDHFEVQQLIRELNAL
jgi:uncharacterized protein